MAEFRLHRLTWPEVEEALPRTAAVLIPVGSTEQHGPHVPLDNDIFTSQALADRAAELAARRGLTVLVAPPLYFGVSWYHMQFPGSIRLEVTTFIDVVLQICDSLRTHGFRTLILVNSHGGNAHALQVAINMAYERWRERIYLAQWWDLTPDLTAAIEGPQIHIEEGETSLALALGQRVELARARRDCFVRREALAALGHPTSRLVRYDASCTGPALSVAMDYLRDITPSGVVGDATRASVETGVRLRDAAVDRLVQAIADLAAPARAGSPAPVPASVPR